jgi:hypothetical protein
MLTKHTKDSLEKLREHYRAKVEQAEANAANTDDPAMRESWRNVAENYKRLADRLK